MLFLDSTQANASSQEQIAEQWLDVTPQEASGHQPDKIEAHDNSDFCTNLDLVDKFPRCLRGPGAIPKQI